MAPGKFPRRQMTILALCRIAEPIALTSVTPYLPAMLRSFHVPEAQIAYWAGLVGTTYAASNAATAMIWGRASDYFGRKYCIVAGMICNAITIGLWGFSSNLKMALITRALEGIGNGNVGIMRTMVSDMSDELDEKAEARAFSILPMMYNIGAVLGPAYAGLLANPLHRGPDDVANAGDPLLWRYPFALPNIICSVLFLLNAIFAVLFLKETLEEKRHLRDRGTEIGDKLILFASRVMSRRNAEQHDLAGNERQPLLDSETSSGSSNDLITTATNGDTKAKGRKVFTKSSLLALAVYGMIPIQSFTYDQQMSWILAFPYSGPDVGETHPPFKFSRGYGLGTKQISIFYGVAAAMGIINQIWSPRFYNRHNMLKSVGLALVTMPVLMVLTLFCVLPSSFTVAMVCISAVWIVKGFCAAFAYPCATMMVKKNAPSASVVGTLNGMGTAIAAIGRAIGPAIAGPVFSFGVQHGYMITSFWTMAVISCLGPLVVLYARSCEKADVRSNTTQNDTGVNGASMATA